MRIRYSIRSYFLATAMVAAGLQTAIGVATWARPAWRPALVLSLSPRVTTATYRPKPRTRPAMVRSLIYCDFPACTASFERWGDRVPTAELASQAEDLGWTTARQQIPGGDRLRPLHYCPRHARHLAVKEGTAGPLTRPRSE